MMSKLFDIFLDEDPEKGITNAVLTKNTKAAAVTKVTTPAATRTRNSKKKQMTASMMMANCHRVILLQGFIIPTTNGSR